MTPHRHSKFEDAVREYFAAKTGREVGRVHFEFEDAIWYSTLTGGEDARFTVLVYDTAGNLIEAHTNASAGEFLTALFAFEGEDG